MSDRPSRRLVLLAAYEDFTRRESVSLRDENFELLGQLQDKKSKVAAELSALADEPDAAEREDFERRIAQLLEKEEDNARLLAQKMASNRQELRQLSKNSVSANNLKRTYAAPIDRSRTSGTLKDRA